MKTNNWKEFNIGDKVHYSTVDFDGPVEIDCTVLDKCNNYIKLWSENDFCIWIDDLTDAKITKIYN